MPNRLFRRLLVPLALVAATFFGTANAAVAGGPTGPISAIAVHRCSSQGTYMILYINQQPTWCIGGRGTLNNLYTNVTQMRSGDNAGKITYRNGPTYNTLITLNYVKNGTYNFNQARIQQIVIN